MTSKSKSKSKAECLRCGKLALRTMAEEQPGQRDETKTAEDECPRCGSHDARELWLAEDDDAR